MNSELKVNKRSVIIDKSYQFALAIVLLNKNLVNQNEYVLSKQILRSGTSIGANINESQSAESKKDFVHKLNISLKEARETNYWLNLLKDGGYLPEDEFKILEKTCTELIKILSSIIITTKNKYLNNS